MPRARAATTTTAPSAKGERRIGRTPRGVGPAHARVPLGARGSRGFLVHVRTDRRRVDGVAHAQRLRDPRPAPLSPGMGRGRKPQCTFHELPARATRRARARARDAVWVARLSRGPQSARCLDGGRDAGDPAAASRDGPLFRRRELAPGAARRESVERGGRPDERDPRLERLGGRGDGGPSRGRGPLLPMGAEGRSHPSDGGRGQRCAAGVARGDPVRHRMRGGVCARGDLSAMSALPPAGYTRGAIAFHWIVAALIVFNLAYGFYLVDLPLPPPKLPSFSYHHCVGIPVLPI